MRPGLQSNRPSGAAESQVLHALGRWAGETGLGLVSLQPERLTEETLLPEIEFRASGTGSMATVSRFLWRLETAEIPLRIKGLQLTSRKDGQDDLSLQLTFSTLYVPTDETDRPAAEGAVLVPPWPRPDSGRPDPFGAGRAAGTGAARTPAVGEGP